MSEIDGHHRPDAGRRRRRPGHGPAAHPRRPARRQRGRRRLRPLRRGPDRRGHARPLPRPRPHPARRHRGHRAAAPGRARHLGVTARPGGRPGRLRPGDEEAGLRLPDLPRARRRLVPRRRPAQPARPLPRRQPRRLGPQREELPPLHDRHRRADAPRDRVCDGDPARRGGRHRRPGPRRRRHRLLRRRRDRAGRRQRVVRLRRRQQRPDRLLLPEQPVGHLRAERPADPHPALPARPRVRVPRRPGRRQRRARGVCGDEARARGGPLRSGPVPRRGVDLPDGRPHDVGRPDQVPRLRRGRGLEAARPDRAAQGLPRPRGQGRPRLLRRGRPRGRRAGRPRPRGLPDDARPDAGVDVRQRLRRAASAASRRSGASSPPTRASFAGEEVPA